MGVALVLGSISKLRWDPCLLQDTKQGWKENFWKPLQLPGEVESVLCSMAADTGRGVGVEGEESQEKSFILPSGRSASFKG